MPLSYIPSRITSTSRESMTYIASDAGTLSMDRKRGPFVEGGGGDLLSVNLFCLHPLGFPSPIYMYVQVLLKFTQCTLHGSWTAWYLSLHTVTSHNIMWTRAPPSAHVPTTDIPYAWCIGTVIMPCLRKHMYTYIASGGSYTPPHDS